MILLADKPVFVILYTIQARSQDFEWGGASDPHRRTAPAPPARVGTKPHKTALFKASTQRNVLIIDVTVTQYLSPNYWFICDCSWDGPLD